MASISRFDPVLGDYSSFGFTDTKNAFNPSSRSTVYQMAERARQDQDFARKFAVDVMLGRDLGSLADMGPGWVDPASLDPESKSGSAPKDKYTGFVDGLGDLGVKAKVPFNYYASWVPQAFTTVVQGDDGGWYGANAVSRDYDPKTAGWSFAGRKKISDQNIISQIEGGHYAFKATGADGKDVYFAWNGDFMPSKSSGDSKTGDAEAARKQTRSAGVDRQMTGVGQASPGNVIGGLSQTLLGGTARNEDLQTLLGRTAL